MALRRKRLETVSRKSAPYLVQQLLYIVEPWRLAGLMLSLGLADLGQEDCPAKGAELCLIALVALGIHDVRRSP